MKCLLIKLCASILFLTLIFSCETAPQKSIKTEHPNDETNQSIMIFTAASLTDVLHEIVDSFEVKHHVKVQINMASSGTLARQIVQGGEPDVYISASKKWIDYVDSLGYVLTGTKAAIAKNELVLIAPINRAFKIEAIDSSLDFTSLIGKDRLSMGDPLHVPAGKYARQSLEHFGWYKQLKGKTLLAKDVRSALMVVEMEEAPLGIVYHTDAQKSAKVKIVTRFPETSYEPIVYMGGLCKNNSTAKAFLEFVKSETTKEIWAKYGFRQ